MNPSIEKKIKKGISKGVKYLQQYRLKVVDYEHRKKTVYDGGATILLSFMQGRYAVDFGFEKNCENLVKCAQDYSIDHQKSMFWNRILGLLNQGVSYEEDVCKNNIDHPFYFSMNIVSSKTTKIRSDCYGAPHEL